MLIEKFPWKKDVISCSEAKELFKRKQFENYARCCFSDDLERELDAYIKKGERLNLVFKQDGSPNAILYNEKAEEAVNVVFLDNSSEFKEFEPKAGEADIIICFKHDWSDVYPSEECPLPVYVMRAH